MEREDDYYSNRRREEGSMRACMFSIVGIILVLLFSFLFSGCKNIQYVPIEKVKTQYIVKTDTFNKIDTLISEKETIIKEADSSIITKLGLQLKDNERAILILKKELERQVSKESEHKIDTIIKIDSIPVPYPVERKLTKWEQTKMDMGSITVGVCIAFVLIIIICFIVRAYKKV